MKRKALRLVIAALLVVGCGSATVPPAAVSSSKDPELWVTEQAASKVLVLRGQPDHPQIETIDLPAGTGPHITTFSPDRRYAYVSGMGNGDLVVINALSHQIEATLHLGPAATHQAKSSPDGLFLFVAQVATQRLVKVVANEASHTWTVANSISFKPLSLAPVCTIFRNDGQRAYVSLKPTGLAIVDVTSMEIVKTLPVAGFIACGMVKSTDGRSVTIASSGGGGHIYRLDTASEQLADLGALGASDWHSFNMTADGAVGVGSEPTADEVRVINLGGTTATTIAVVPLDPTPGPANDEPDAIGISGQTAWVSLRMSGKLAVIDLARLTVLTYLDLAPAAPSINPTNCAGCALHGVTVRS